VRQVRFNAWHYAETDFGPAFVTELFAQLAAPADANLSAEQRRQSRLADLVTLSVLDAGTPIWPDTIRWWAAGNANDRAHGPGH
jgi:hypothetical protein